jgi:hypothetical protein
VGTLMIKCPKTGRAISTGMIVEASRYGATPVFYSRTYCPTCRINHDWFATEAWVCDHSSGSPTAMRAGMSADPSVLAAWAMGAQGRGRRSR